MTPDDELYQYAELQRAKENERFDRVCSVLIFACLLTLVLGYAAYQIWRMAK